MTRNKRPETSPVRCYCGARAVYVIVKRPDPVGLCAICADALRDPATFGWEEAAA